MKSFDRVGWSAAVALAGAALVLLPLACKHGSTGEGEEYLKWLAANPEIDARGGDAYGYLGGNFSPTRGYGGAGGSIEIESASGTVTIQRATAALTPPTQTLSGGSTGGLLVRAGEIVHTEGGHFYDWVDIQAGGTLVLVDNATLVVGDPGVADGLGHVHIAGRVQSSRFRTLDGFSFTVAAKGTVVISGIIDCSGGDGGDTFGGNGGEIYIYTTDTSSDSVTLTGEIIASGGDSHGTSPTYSVGGEGGLVTLASYGGLRIQGALRARGGDCLTSNNADTPPGGSVAISAVGDITVAGIRRISARGGDSDGFPGDAGTVLLAARNAPLNLLDVEVNADGGGGLRGCLSEAGDAGEIEIVGLTVTSSGRVLARGGSILSDNDPDADLDMNAGEGGEISIVTSAAATLSGGTVSVEGGAAELDGFVGDGGTLRLAVIGDTSSIQVVPGWTGSASGGLGPRGELGDHGTVCVTGDFASPSDDAYFQDQLPFPPAGCGSSTINGIAIPLELDDDDGTFRPAQHAARIPSGIAVHFWRVYANVGEDVSVSTTGETGGDLDLYVGPQSLFGSTDTSLYPESGETLGTSTEAVTYTVPSGSTYITVLLVEWGGFSETYTVTVEVN